MVKKVIVWSLLATGVVFVANHVRPGAIHTAWKRVHTKIEAKISPDFELARIRDQIAQLTPDMGRNIQRIAEESVQVEALERKLGDLQARLTQNKEELAKFTDAIGNGVTKVSLNGRDVPVTAIRGKLTTCYNLERELKNVSKIYEAKRSGVDAARQQLMEMKRQKEELEIMAAEYDAELRTLALEETRAKVQLDDSRLAEIKQSFEQLRQRIDVARKTADLAEQFKGDTFTERKPAQTKDAADEAREYLGADRSKIDATKK